MTPLELAPFAPLLRRLGVADDFTAQQYAAVLAAMADGAKDEVLDEKSLAQAISIVQVGTVSFCFSSYCRHTVSVVRPCSRDGKTRFPCHRSCPKGVTVLILYQQDWILSHFEAGSSPSG